MKTDHEKVNRLRQETGRDYGFCQKALIKNRNDYERALEYINNYDDRFFVRSYKHLVSIWLGEKSYRLILSSPDETMINIPLLVPVVVCIVLPIPSIVIAFLMLLVMLTNSSLRLEVGKPEPAEKTAAKKAEKTAKKVKSNIPHTVSTDEDGYSTIDIV